MPNKTIIDGIDVSYCRYYRLDTEQYEHVCKLTNKLCRCNNNCHFKQLARQKELSVKQSKELIRLRKELEEKEQECEELKSNNKILCDMWKTADRNNAKHVVQTDNYKQALDEIESYVKSKCCTPCQSTTQEVMKPARVALSKQF